MAIYDIEGMGLPKGSDAANAASEAKMHAKICAGALLKRDKNAEKMAATLREMLQRDK